MRRDHVDGMVEGWAERLPGVDLTRAGAVARIRRLARIYDEATDAALDELGLAGGAFDVLSALRREPSQTLTPSGLVRSLLLSAAAMTNRLDRLERAGLISRNHDTDDRRVIRISLTQKGKVLADRALKRQAANADRLLRSFSDAQLARLSDVLRDALLSAEAVAGSHDPDMETRRSSTRSASR